MKALRVGRHHDTQGRLWLSEAFHGGLQPTLCEAAPRHEADAHRPLNRDAEALRLITSEQHERTLSKSLSCRYRGPQYLIQTEGSRTIIT
ncbi:MAG: hypothetical protein Q4B17_05105 [Lautropia sp.]|nr:hypothetical protein [Lautropia sp.]